MNPTDLILSNFQKVSSIPRGTKYEARIRNWLIAWAAEQNCTCKTDAAGNLVIYAPASKGDEDLPTLILQGHMDMVWQKTPESNHDFEHDPIQLIHDGDWLRANGTTLGADNGVGIALMMSIVEDESVKHSPLELLLTVEEEMGVVGADNLDPSLLSGKALINLDSETEGVFTIGCANVFVVSMLQSQSRRSLRDALGTLPNADEAVAAISDTFAGLEKGKIDAAN